MPTNTISYCLLCAEDTSVNNIRTYSISVSTNGIKDTLIACSQWRESFESDTMPRVVCATCSDELFRCSRFFEQITRAEQKLILLQGNVKQETPLELSDEHWCDDNDPMDDYDPLNEPNNLNEPDFGEILIETQTSAHKTRSTNDNKSPATTVKRAASTGQSRYIIYVIFDQ